MPGIVLGLPDRTFQRARGCWNCIHWENGDLFLQHYKIERAKAAAKLRFIPPHVRAEDLVPSSPHFYRRVGEIKSQHEGMTDNEAVRLALLEERGSLFQRLAKSAETAASRFRLFDTEARAGRWGLCMNGRLSKALFKAAECLCEGWTGRQGSSVATEGAPLDKLADELKDKVDGHQ